MGSIALLNFALLDFLMNRVLIAVCAKLLQLKASSRVATVLLCGVARYAIGALIGVATALGTFERNYKADTFCHNFG